jgi:hypothetical protein
MSAVTDTFYSSRPSPLAFSFSLQSAPSPSSGNPKMDAGVAVPEMTSTVARWPMDQSIHPQLSWQNQKIFPSGHGAIVDPTDRVNW